jgi:hypothetical protein
MVTRVPLVPMVRGAEPPRFDPRAAPLLGPCRPLLGPCRPLVGATPPRSGRLGDVSGPGREVGKRGVVGEDLAADVDEPLGQTHDVQRSADALVELDDAEVVELLEGLDDPSPGGPRRP